MAYYSCAVNVAKAHLIKFIDSQLHLLDQKFLISTPDSVQDFFNCLASIPQFYSQFLANQYRQALELRQKSDQRAT